MISKEQAKKYLKRWKEVAEIEKKELRASTFNDRLLQTLSLMGMGISMAAYDITKIRDDSSGVNKVRGLWITLKEKMP